MRIVVSDGQAEVRGLRCQWISTRFPGTRVISAASLTEAIRVLVEHHPVGMAIMDLTVPGINGLNGLSTVRRFFPEVRCVAVGAPEPATIEEALTLGIRGFLADDATEAEFAAAVAAVLSGKRHFPSPALAAPPQADLRFAADFTPREKDILLLLRDGLSNKVIANRLAVSEVTVKTHLGNVFRKLGVQNRLQALRMVVESERV